ncbi:hypothetical protein HMPREF2826_01685 [Olsenella sp. HMSC062G07]|nr:hypothetical protein HMPREF2826_01685 [Olsenella sp. HMSC062G07]
MATAEVHTMHETYEAQVDFEGFRELYLAQHGGYLKRLFALAGGLCLLVSLLCWVIVIGESDPVAILIALGFTALTIACIAGAVHPMVAFFTRKGVVYDWFASHGRPSPSDTRLQDLRTSYQVSLEDEGFQERATGSSSRIPWFALKPRPIKGRRGTYFARANGKEGSVAYNLIGINWAFRDESVEGVLFVPAAVSAAHPGLVGAIEGKINDGRARLRGRGARTARPSDQATVDWMRGTPQDRP